MPAKQVQIVCLVGDRERNENETKTKRKRKTKNEERKTNCNTRRKGRYRQESLARHLEHLYLERQLSMTSAENNRSPQQGCPVDHQQKNPTPLTTPAVSPWNPFAWFSPPLASEPTLSARQANAEGCPVDHSRLAIPASLEASARHPQSPHPDQRIPLSTHRVVSSIPRADDVRADEGGAAPVVPSHQPVQENKWVYPSEQQFYNAMRRKGWNGFDESTIPQVVYIHNAVNERSWNHVKRWERELHNNPNPRLVKFMGRPNDMSPRALFNTYLLFYHPPFDRHDWYVDGGDGKPPRRYVIDFYNGKDPTLNSGILATLFDRVVGSRGGNRQSSEGQSSAPRPPSIYLDVRPALDSPSALSARCKMFFIDTFPAIYATIQSRNHLPPPPPAATSASSAATLMQKKVNNAFVQEKPRASNN